MKLSRHWPLFASLLLSAAGCADSQAAGATEEPLAESSAELVHRKTSTASEETFTAFESGQVRPLALSQDGRVLYAVNTPDNRLEVFRVDGARLHALGSVMVGLEPVSVAVRSDDEVWVVNHLSDSISVVDVSEPREARVVRTLLVGDEPRDLVFASGKAFITTAHRGQNTGRDPQFTTPGVGRADVWVFDPQQLGDTLEGTPLTVISLFADTPRALAVSPDGETVYAAAFHSGNRTTVIDERAVTNFGGLPPPLASGAGVPAPWAGLIVKYRVGTPDGQYHWLDEINRVWDEHVLFNLPDKDVFAIDASAATPAPKAGGEVASVGTILFNMAVNPVNGKVYVSNLESFNEVRFEGHNTSYGEPTVRGHIVENRISVVDGTSVATRHLNKHIDYSADGSEAERETSLALPTGLAVSPDGKQLFVAAFGSSKLGVYDTAKLEDDSFVPSTDDQVALSGGGPTGLVLDGRGRLAYVMTRFDNGISVVDTKHKREVAHRTMYNPEPASITNGRRFLYDAEYTSGHGDSACASCHIFADFDGLAWDLGDPDAPVKPNPGPFTVPSPAPQYLTDIFFPLKGPMTTQSIRGVANHGPMHWRGDRTDGNNVPASAQPDTGTFNEIVAFEQFNVAFDSLLARGAEIDPAEMRAFTDFALQITYPPNPVRSLDNSLNELQAKGRAFYFQNVGGQELPSDTFHNCNGCHVLNPEGNAEFGVLKPGFFGSDGRYTFDNLPQFMKVPHLRNAYQKVGMFGRGGNFMLPIDRPAPLPNIASSLPPPLTDDSFMGDQIRGFGFLHDGGMDTLYRFFGSTSFVQRPLDDPFPNPFGIPPDATGIGIRRALEAFVLAYDSNLAPIVGQQVTLTSANGAVAMSRIALLKQRAAAGECELVVRGRFGRHDRGFLYVPESGTFATDDPKKGAISEADLLALVDKSELTFTAVPVANGERIALDRDSDGKLDGADCDDRGGWAFAFGGQD